MTQSIQLTDVIAYYKGLEHQKAAIAYLQNAIPKEILEKFAELWRTAQKQRQIDQTGLNLIKEFEGIRLNTYDDGVGVPTIGYGHILGVTWGMAITIAEAEQFLKEDLTYFENGVNELVQVPLTDNQFSSLVSFAFNVGVGAFEESTLLRVLNQKDYEAASDQFLRWVNGGGKVMAGLVRRREAERNLFLSES
jgi:GH24 family phage-related lysozyme (muramidase)